MDSLQTLLLKEVHTEIMEASKCNGCACMYCDRNERIPGNYQPGVSLCNKCPNTNDGTCYKSSCNLKNEK